MYKNGRNKKLKRLSGAIVRSTEKNSHIGCLGLVDDLSRLLLLLRLIRINVGC
jgi:hypothetical protein